MTGDAVVGLLFLVGVAFFIGHLVGLGGYYIKFDGITYWVWQKAFLGYDECRGMYWTEHDARDCIERLKKNPPRNIAA